MEYIVVFIICVITIIILKFAFQVKIRDVKKIKEIGHDKELNELTNVLPENKIVCEEILKKLDNESVIIEEIEEKDKTLTYYSIITNHIIIADIKDTFTRIQTIAHECVHSVQNRVLLYFNFIFSNIYLLYFAIVSILTICKVVKIPILQIAILLVLGLIYYSVRGYLENDAMTRAFYIAKEYMEGKEIFSKNDIIKISENYKILNKIGIPMTNFMLLTKVIIKVMVYCIIAIIV